MTVATSAQGKLAGPTEARKCMSCPSVVGAHGFLRLFTVRLVTFKVGLFRGFLEPDDMILVCAPHGVGMQAPCDGRGDLLIGFPYGSLHTNTVGVRG
jgi:hypothetical protein